MSAIQREIFINFLNSQKDIIVDIFPLNGYIYNIRYTDKLLAIDRSEIIHLDCMTNFCRTYLLFLRSINPNKIILPVTSSKENYDFKIDCSIVTHLYQFIKNKKENEYKFVIFARDNNVITHEEASEIISRIGNITNITTDMLWQNVEYWLKRLKFEAC